MKGKTDFKTDKRRKHHHFEVTISYNDGEKFVRMYTDKMKAARIRRTAEEIASYQDGASASSFLNWSSISASLSPASHSATNRLPASTISGSCLDFHRAMISQISFFNVAVE